MADKPPSSDEAGPKGVSQASEPQSDARPRKIRTWWHPLLASLLRRQLGNHYHLEEEVPVGQKPLQIDLLLLQKEHCCLSGKKGEGPFQYDFKTTGGEDGLNSGESSYREGRKIMHSAFCIRLCKETPSCKSTQLPAMKRLQTLPPR